MRKHLAIVLALAAAAACTFVQNDNQNTNGPSVLETPKPDASPTPKPSAAPGGQGASCPTIVATTLGSTGGQTATGVPIAGAVRTAPVGSTLNLDITPRDAAGQAVPASCHDPAPSVQITQAGAFCALGASWSSTGGAYTPTLRMLAAGTCLVTASANGHSESKDFAVTAAGSSSVDVEAMKRDRAPGPECGRPPHRPTCACWTTGLYGTGWAYRACTPPALR